MNLLWYYGIVSKSNPIHVDIFRVFFLMINRGIYSINTLAMMGNSHEILNSSQLFLKLNRFDFYNLQASSPHFLV